MQALKRPAETEWQHLVGYVEDFLHTPYRYIVIMRPSYLYSSVKPDYPKTRDTLESIVNTVGQDSLLNNGNYIWIVYGIQSTKQNAKEYGIEHLP